VKRLVAGLAVAAVVAAGCSGGGDDDKDAKVSRDLIQPDFAPDDGSGGTSTSAGSSGQGDGTPGVFVKTQAALTDPKGDATTSVADPAPSWADLRGGTLLRTAQGFQLRIRMADSVPHRGDATHTINVASFYDVDGDGSIDYEVWANLAEGGWGTSWFDDRNRRALVMEGDRVNVEIVGDEVVLRFPLGHIGDAERFRWSLAMEWGRRDALGTLGTVRDDAPDDDRAAPFPG
jgi:hypothetical protein